MQNQRNPDDIRYLWKKVCRYFSLEKPKASPERTAEKAYLSDVSLVVLVNYPIILVVGIWELIRWFGNQMPEVYRQSVASGAVALPTLSFVVFAATTYTLSLEIGKESLSKWATTSFRRMAISGVAAVLTLVVFAAEFGHLNKAMLPVAIATPSDPRNVLNGKIGIGLAASGVLLLCFLVFAYMQIRKAREGLALGMSTVVNRFALGASVVILLAAGSAGYHVEVGRAVGSLAVLDILMAAWMAVIVWLLLPRVGNRFVMNVVIGLAVLTVFSGQKNRTVEVRNRPNNLEMPNLAETNGLEKQREQFSVSEEGRLKERFKAWYALRKPSGPDLYPVVLVCADGGGISAAAVASEFFGVMADATKNQFQQHVFCASTVSGGSVGLATFLALDTQTEETNQSSIRAKLRRVMAQDHLAPMILNMLSTEILGQIWPFGNLPDADRSRYLVRSFESAMRSQFVDDASPAAIALGVGADPLSAYSPWEPPQIAPIKSNRDHRFFLVPNATVAETGKRFAMTDLPITLGASLSTLRYYSPRHEPSLMDVASLSARFPIVPSSGFLPIQIGNEAGGVALVDGGLAENSGISTMSEIYRTLLTTPEAQHCKFFIVHIGTVPGDGDPVVQSRPDVAIKTYFDTAANVLLSGNGRAAKELDRVFREKFLADDSPYRQGRAEAPSDGGTRDNRFERQLVTMSIFVAGGEYQLPLGWTISEAAVKDIEYQLGADLLDPDHSGEFDSKRFVSGASSQYVERKQENLKQMRRLRDVISPTPSIVNPNLSPAN